MNVETLKKLYAYNRWANEQVWECVAALPEADYLAEHDYSVGSLFDQVFHMMQTEWWVIKSLNGTLSTAEELSEDNCKNRDTLWQKWQAVDAEITAYLDTLTDADLQKSVKFSAPEGYDEIYYPAWESHMVLINHGTNHRAQVLALLYKRGGKTVEQGYYFHVLARETAKASA